MCVKRYWGLGSYSVCFNPTLSTWQVLRMSVLLLFGSSTLFYRLFEVRMWWTVTMLPDATWSLKKSYKMMQYYYLVSKGQLQWKPWNMCLKSSKWKDKLTFFVCRTKIILFEKCKKQIWLKKIMLVVCIYPYIVLIIRTFAKLCLFPLTLIIILKSHIMTFHYGPLPQNLFSIWTSVKLNWRPYSKGNHWVKEFNPLMVGALPDDTGV